MNLTNLFEYPDSIISTAGSYQSRAVAPISEHAQSS